MSRLTKEELDHIRRLEKQIIENRRSPRVDRSKLQSVLAQVDKTKGDSKYPYTSHALPKNMPGCPTDKDGHPIITSRNHEAEVARRWGLVRALE